MAEQKIPTVKLGNQGLKVSKLGFGCGSLSGVYNSPLSHEDGISVIKHAFEKGIAFFDTADLYGATDNEVLIGKALKQLPREKIQLATKFGCYKFNQGGAVIKGTPEYVQTCCEASLKRLDVDYIDLYYQHRVVTSVPIEDTMGELKKLVEEGKIKYIGLSEASPDTIRHAHAVHPITALQMEWSLWSRDIEEEIIPLCRQGFLDSQDNFDKNKILYERFANLVVKHRCTPSQLALAWLFHQGEDVVPIPGTTKIKNMDVNIGSLEVKLTYEDLKEISDAVPIDEVKGPRIHEHFLVNSWKFANNPPKVSNV